MKLLQKATDPAFWKKVQTDSAYAPLLDSLKNLYYQNRQVPLPPLTAGDREVFFHTGSRVEFETKYFMRRRFLTAAALLSLVYPEEKKYLFDTENAILSVSDEYSWALPAHTDRPQGNGVDVSIDLFAAETGLELTEVCYLLAERLNPNTRRRAENEVRRRLINSFLSNSFGWEQDKSNWAAVCAGNVGSCFLYLAPERFHEVSKRIFSALECFLSSYPDDGTCLEGFSYWHYGFGEFVRFADLLFEFTDGKHDLLNNKKTEKIAAYARRSFLAGDASVSFSDGSRTEKAELGLMHRLAARFPKSVRLLPARLMTNAVGNLGWHKQSRLFLDFDPALQEEELPLSDYFADDAGQAVINRKAYSLAVKAGCNGEPHNHNDVGSFILATQCGQVIADLGAGLYTKQYFSPETRYAILCNSSRGHSVPIVNGEYQTAGDCYRGTLSHTDGSITVEMAGAYAKGPAFLTRRFFYSDRAVRLTDTFPDDLESFTERLILLEEPALFDGYVTVQNVKITFDKRVTSPVLSTARHALHAPIDGKTEETVYLLDFPIKRNQSSVALLFEIL